jgi:hypothetical protein
MSSAYIKFAGDNPHLYEAMMSLHAPGHDATYHQSLWTFTVSSRCNELPGPTKLRRHPSRFGRSYMEPQRWKPLKC